MATVEAGEERRNEERAPIALRVDYKRLNTFFADYTRNISKGGTFIQTDRPLDVGTEFKFILALPSLSGEDVVEDREGVSIELDGVVRWVVTTDEATEEMPAGMGIEFVFADDEARTRVEELVLALMRNSLGVGLADKLLGRARR